MEKELYQTDKKNFEANKDEQVKIESTRVESNDYHPLVVANRCGWCGGWRWSHNKGERCGWWLEGGGLLVVARRRPRHCWPGGTAVDSGSRRKT